ncbi:MAG TPA: nuclear transport factor 2 family protein [Acidimicrobiales bacterium]|nr:nuclear transport factor 2 family protein [Acidimicrobiales bacterium]
MAAADDRLAVTDLIYTYAERIDAGDFEGVADLLADADLTFEGFDAVRRGRDQILALYRATTRRYPDGTPRTRHLVTNVIVERGPGEDRSSSRSTFTVLQAVDGALALQPIVAGRYRHRFERTGDDWRITSLHMAVELVGDVGHHLLSGRP